MGFRSARKYYFIVSTGRTGTKFLAKALNQLSNEISAYHEPNPRLIRLKWEFGVARFSFDEAIKTFLLKRYDIINNSQRSLYIESNPYLLFLVPILEKVFPNCKIIHIIRDGRNWVRSALNRGIYNSLLERTPYQILKIFRSEFLSKIWEIPYIKRYFFKFYKDLWRFRAPDFKNDRYSNRWNDMNQFEKLSWMWMKFNRYIFNYKCKTSNVVTIHFEDIFNSKKNFIGGKNLLEFFEIGEFWKDFQNLMNKTEKINETKHYLIPHWRNWTSQYLRRFDEIAGDVMKLFNYY